MASCFVFLCAAITTKSFRNRKHTIVFQNVFAYHIFKILRKRWLIIYIKHDAIFTLNFTLPVVMSTGISHIPNFLQQYRKSDRVAPFPALRLRHQSFPEPKTTMIQHVLRDLTREINLQNNPQKHTPRITANVEICAARLISFDDAVWTFTIFWCQDAYRFEIKNSFILNDSLYHIFRLTMK